MPAKKKKLPKAAPTAGCPRRQSTLPLVTSLTLYKRPTLLALNVIYGYGYRAVSSVLFTVYCKITCGGDSPQCGEMSAKLTEGTGCSAPLSGRLITHQKRAPSRALFFSYEQILFINYLAALS